MDFHFWFVQICLDIHYQGKGNKHQLSTTGLKGLQIKRTVILLLTIAIQNGWRQDNKSRTNAEEKLEIERMLNKEQEQ